MELENTKYILYVSYDKNKNIIDFCKSLQVKIKNCDYDDKNLIKIHSIIFDEIII